MAATSPSPASAFNATAEAPPAGKGGGSLKIDAVDLLELSGHYTRENGVDRQAQVNPLRATPPLGLQALGGKRLRAEPKLKRSCGKACSWP